MCGIQASLADQHPVLICALARNKIAQAFTLLREAGRCDSLASWNDYALAFIAKTPDAEWPSGIVVAEQANRCIVGLYSYFVRPCLRSGRVLAVGDLTVMAPFGRDVIADRLLDSVAELARSQHISEVEIGLASASGWWGAMLGKRNYKLDDRRQMVWRSVVGADRCLVMAQPVSTASPGS